MVDVSKYKTYPELFEGLEKELNISQNKLGELVGKSGATISKIKHSKMNPSTELLITLCKELDLDLQQVLSLEKTYNVGEASKQVKLVPKEELTNQKETPNTYSDTDDIPVNQSALLETPEDTSIEKQTGASGHDVLEHMIKNYPKMAKLYQLMLSGGNEEAIELRIDEHINLENTRIYNSSPKYVFRDLKEKILEVVNSWKRMGDLPGYNHLNKEEINLSFNLEGYLDLPDNTIYIALSSNENSLTLTTLYKDRHRISNLLDIVPGAHFTESKNGKVGSMAFYEPIINMHVFNLASLENQIKGHFANTGVDMQKLKFDRCDIASFFNDRKEK